MREQVEAVGGDVDKKKNKEIKMETYLYGCRNNNTDSLILTHKGSLRGAKNKAKRFCIENFGFTDWSATYFVKDETGSIIVLQQLVNPKIYDKR